MEGRACMPARPQGLKPLTESELHVVCIATSVTKSLQYFDLIALVHTVYMHMIKTIHQLMSQFIANILSQIPTLCTQNCWG